MSNDTNNKGTSHLLDTGYLRLEEVLKYIPVCRASWYKGIQEGKYPKQRKLGKNSRAVGWKAEDIRSLINEIDQQM